MKVKKFLSIFLVLAMVISLLPGFTILARAAASGSWADYTETVTPTTWSDGTKEYNVSTGGQLAYVANLINTAADGESELYAHIVIQLSGQIDLSEHYWVPIGSGLYPFYGSFLGNGHTITGLTTNASSGFSGLFASASRAAISGVNLKDASVNATYSSSNICNAGALAGKCERCSINNCTVSGSVSGDGNETSYVAVGGLIGYSSENTISDCSSSANVSMSNGNNGYIGGLIGQSVSTDNISSSYASGNVTVGSIYSGTGYAGGFVGNIYDAGGSIKKSYATGNVTGKFIYGGGFVGKTESNSGTIENCYSTGDVICDTDSDSFAGGFAGYSGTDEVTYFYFAGTASGAQYNGGFAGQYYPSTAPSAVYYSTATSGLAATGLGLPACATGMSLSDMQTSAFAETLNGAQSPAPWARISGVNDGCPVLNGVGDGTLAAVQPDYTVTGGPTSFQVDGSSAYTTLAAALAACTNSGADGNLTIQLGSETNSLRVSERNFSSNHTANTLSPATYLGNVEILDDTAITDGVGLITGGTVIFDAVKISSAVENETSFAAVYVKYGKSLTINSGTFTVSGANSRCLTSEAVLTINDGTLTGSGTGFICIDNQNTDSGTGTLTIKGGTFHVEGSKGIIINNAGKMTVAGGSFSAGNGTQQDTVCIKNSASPSSNSSVSGGTFTSTDPRGVGIQNIGYLTVSGSSSISIPFQTIRMDSGTLIISDGTVTADAANGTALVKTGPGQVTISGGSISGKSGAIINVGSGTINISGGNLSSEGTAVNSFDGTVNISGGSISCSGNMSTISIQSSGDNTSLTLSGAAKLISANGVAVSIQKASGTNTLGASIFGKTIHGNASALIRVISGRGVEMNSSSFSNCALFASDMGGSSFDAWTGDDSLQNVSSTTNGEVLSNLASDIYLKTGSGTSVNLTSGSLGTAGNATISGLTAGKTYKVTMGGITFYSTGAGYLAFDPAYSGPLAGTELIGLINGSAYFVEDCSAAVILSAGSLGTAGNGKITGRGERRRLCNRRPGG